MGVERVGAPVALPRGYREPCCEHTVVAVQSNAEAFIILAACAIEGVPLVGSAAVELEHRDIGITAATMRM